VAQPGSEATVESNMCGTFTAQADRCIDTQHVPLNDSQRAAVLGLRGGFDIIHGKLHTDTGAVYLASSSFITVHCLAVQ
jgi:hypothetical protein